MLLGYGSVIFIPNIQVYNNYQKESELFGLVNKKNL